MADPATVYGHYNIYYGETMRGLHLENDDIVVLLCDNTFVFDATDEYISDIVATEISGATYSRQGLIGIVTVSNVLACATVDFSDPSWVALIPAFQFAVIAKNTGSDSTSPLLCYFGWDSAYAAVAKNVTLQVPTAGLFRHRNAGTGF